MLFTRDFAYFIEVIGTWVTYFFFGLSVRTFEVIVKSFSKLVKSQWNFLEHFAIYVRSVYIQIQMNFNIKHVC